MATDGYFGGMGSVNREASTRAMLAGEIGYAHLALLARTAINLTSSGSSSGFDEAGLLEQARRHTVGRFREDCDHARHAADRQRFLDEEIDKREARTLELRPYQNGCLGLRGFLDPEGARS